MFTKYKCFGEDQYVSLIRFKDIEIGDIFVINYDFTKPMIKTSCESSCESSEQSYCAIDLIDRRFVCIAPDKPVAVFTGQLNLPVSYYKLYRKD